MFSILIDQAVARFPEFRFATPVSWHIREGENWVVIGPNGSGKTVLTDILQGRVVLKEGKVEVYSDRDRKSYQDIQSMAFRDIYTLADCRNMYYQQRWNSSDAEESPWAISLLKGYAPEKIAEYTNVLGIEKLSEKRLIALSSGELRKFLILRTLLSEPRVLILDNPFIGLDATSRHSLSDMLRKMKRLKGLQILLVLSNPEDIPDWIDYILPVKEKACWPVMSREAFLANEPLRMKLFAGDQAGKVNLPQAITAPAEYQVVVEMEKIRVKYGNHLLLDGVDWKIHQGEKWALLGKNGSGKSTLLSLICGDNPQAYANRFTLFDRRRGTGESIWEIKRRIGYLSPDIHTYYLQDIPCLEVVASGFFDSIGLYRKCTELQRSMAKTWLQTLEAEHLATRSFVRISYGEQRLVLLARAFVKDPELLILDEPLHGLDAGKKKLARSVIEAFCQRKAKTLIYVTHYPHEIPACVTHYKTMI